MNEDDRLFFTEEQTEGVHLRLRVKKWLLRQRTPLQELVVAETTELGRLLALDGKVMLTEADEAFYHEMLVHPPLMTLEAPQRVAIIGGGDGGAVREILRHPSIQEVMWAEIDPFVIDAARKWLSSVHHGVFDDARVSLTIAPGENWLTQFEKAFDAIILDSTDPVGPSRPLFEVPFFEACRKALKPNGLLSLQCGTPFYFRGEVQRAWRNLKGVFSDVRLYLGFVPTYPSGLWAYALAGQAIPEVSLRELERRQRERHLFPCRYYSPQVHLASFVLPPFVQELLS